MLRYRMRPALTLFTFVLAACVVNAKGKAPVQTAWALAPRGPVEVHSRSSARSKVIAKLGSGTLVAAFKTKTSGRPGWTQVRVVKPATLEAATGWVESSRLESISLEKYPTDSELETLLGGPYLEDVNARYAQIARFLVRNGSHVPALVCYVGSTFLPRTRLQVFRGSGGRWEAGPFIEFFSSQLNTGVTEIEVRDLVSDGNECLITHEPFAETFGASGVNLVIRRVEGGQFKTLWKAPLELRNLASFPPAIKMLVPPEKNIGTAGTVTTGDVDYQTVGRITEPVWKGKVEFYIPGREKPLNQVSVEKACGWNGSEFTPLK